MIIPLVDLKKQYISIKDDIDKALVKVFDQTNFILGKEVEDFENQFAAFLGAKYCVGVASGSQAILLGLRVLDVGEDDEVITVPNTFIATVSPILELGAKPVLVEVDPKTYQMNPQNLQSAITKKTKVILPVHLYGIPAQMDKIIKIAKENGIYVLEDACQAHGSSFKGKKCGTFADLAAFSFYPGKNLGAAGDGGAIVTNSLSLYQKLRAMRNFGQFKKNEHDIFGYNSRLDTIQAAVLSVKLKYLETWNEKRRKIVYLYNKLLYDLPIVLSPQLDNRFMVNYHLYVVRTQKRDALLRYLHQNGIYAGIHYPTPVHLQKAIKDNLGYKKGDFPITEKYAKEIISLPIYAELTEGEVKEISKLIHNFFKTNV